MTIAIVGPEESKWKPEQIPKVKDQISYILRMAKFGHIIEDKGYRTLNRHLEVIFVSGRCPISKCDNCGKKSFSKNEDPIIGYVTCEFCGQQKKRRAGGVDIWSEEIADKLGIKKEMYPAEVHSWGDEKCCHGCEVHHMPELKLSTILGKCSCPCHKDSNWQPQLKRIVLKGYRSRNIQIAEAGKVEEYVLYCIVPKKFFRKDVDKMRRQDVDKMRKQAYCFHCKEWGHPTNGGCFTKNEATKRGRETHLVVIE